MMRIVLLYACLLALPSSAHAVNPEPVLVAMSASDEKSEAELIYIEVRSAIAAEDFARLSAMEQNYRSSSARLPSGMWKLAALYAGLQTYLTNGLQPDRGCEYRRAQFVKRWAEIAPNSPAPLITQASLLRAQAWCFRGSGYANTVAAAAWPRFIGGLTEAADILHRHKKTASIDPEFYAVMLQIIGDHGHDKMLFYKTLTEAISREPLYHRTYFNAAWYLLPQWGGSYAELDAFARLAAQQTSKEDHSGLYARIFWSLDNECECELVQKAADWPTLKLAMRDLYNQYPVKWNGTYFAELSCHLGETEEGHRYLRAIHPEATEEEQFAAIFATCDGQAGARQ